jgi:hypothetical protein
VLGGGGPASVRRPSANDDWFKGNTPNKFGTPVLRGGGPASVRRPLANDGRLQRCKAICVCTETMSQKEADG